LYLVLACTDGTQFAYLLSRQPKVENLKIS
jgi:hypothetical protein